MTERAGYAANARAVLPSDGRLLIPDLSSPETGRCIPATRERRRSQRSLRLSPWAIQDSNL